MNFSCSALDEDVTTIDAILLPWDELTFLLEAAQ